MSIRTLILSCNTGEGHNSCARAIQEVYEANGEVCHIKNALTFLSGPIPKWISGGHVYIYRHCPYLFRIGYRYSERHPVLFHESSGIYRLLATGAERIHRYILDGHYNAVVCTHVFAALMLTEMLKTHPMTLATCFVATDYTCSPGVTDSRLERYFIPDSGLCGDFESSSLPASRLVGSGIPVRQLFYQRTDRATAKRSVGVSPTHRHLLVMCGSMGCGPITDLTKLLANRLPEENEMTIVCGTNRRLQQKLERQYGNHPAIHIRGYVTDTSLLMDSADLYLTKPGGISVSEAAVKDLPMVFIDAVAGCEEYNRQFFLRSGCAATGSSVEELAAVCLSLLSNDEARGQMAQHLRERAKPNAARLIYAYTKEFADREN